MISVGVTANPFNEKALNLARIIHDRLKDRVELSVARDTASALGLPGEPIEDMRVDVLLALGGDGSLLYVLHRTECPVLGINTGTVGFLTEVDPDYDTLDGALERVVRGAYICEDRMKLATRVGDRNLPDAVNEVVIHTAQVARMRTFEVAIDGKPLGRLRADGVILATPTGSTSYSLSTGGPVVDPAIDATVLTAIAPYSAFARPLVVAPLREISVRPVEEDRETVVVVDGHREERLPRGMDVKCYRSARRARLIRFSSHFFQRLQAKALIPWALTGNRADLPPPT
ncbi:MAG: NAD(+)/NADH kinase [Euryarchaeota archaeon]|nr:NAD(+)/NADH kinase [Euryarchaeota archaeon]MDE2044268.1 NAD(+)/NADH kinase [Thermoplasmata archaeon]